MSSFIKKIRNTVKYWYLPLIAGIILVVTGKYCLVSPLASFLGLSILFSISFIVTGISELIFAFSNKEELDGWGWYLVGGLLSLLIGVYLLIHPEISVVTLPFVIGFTVMFKSFQALGFAYDLKNYGILDWGNLAIIGVLGVIFSFILIFNPMFAGLTAVIWTGIAIIVAGAASVYLSLKLKKVNDIPGNISSELKERWESLQTELKNAINK